MDRDPHPGALDPGRDHARSDGVHRRHRGDGHHRGLPVHLFRPMFPAIGGVFIVGFLAPARALAPRRDRRARRGRLLLVLGSQGIADRDPGPVEPVAAGRGRHLAVLPRCSGRSSPPAAAWYRRFLALSSPNRQRQSQTAKAKPGDGRTRSVTRRRPAPSADRLGAEIMGAGMFGLHDARMIRTGADGGATSLRSMSRCSCSPIARARCSRWRAARRSTSSARRPARRSTCASEAAGGKDVRIGGGPTVVREFLKAGLVDRLHVAIVPILLGRGIRLWDDLRGFEDGYR